MISVFGIFGVKHCRVGVLFVGEDFESWIYFHFFAENLPFATPLLGKFVFSKTP
jgi:hypothetical protein